MFLGVSGSVLGVEMTDTERHNFAQWLLGLQRRDFGGSAKAAYTKAGVNSTTWTRATSGLTIKPQTIVKIVNTFRPDAEGDWTRLGLDKPAVGGATQDDLDYVSRAPRTGGEEVESGVKDDVVLEAIEQMRRDVQAMEQRLSERLEKLEKPDA